MAARACILGVLAGVGIGQQCAQAQVLGMSLDSLYAGYARPDATRPGVYVIDLDRGDIPVYARERILGIKSVPAAEARSALASQTGLSYDPQHGTQVSYATKNGSTYLWYPGNQVVVAGNWRVQSRQIEIKVDGRVVRQRDDSSVCYQYGPGSYNPVTRRSGAEVCIPFVSRAQFFRETQAGDVFALTSGSPPFVLGREPTTLAELLARARPLRVKRPPTP